MKALLVQPRAPHTYWGFQHSLGIIGKRASLPPLGLLTLAALLPRDWELRLVDLNVESLADADLRWADALLLTGMLVHQESMHEVLARARRAGLRTVVGGPAATATPAQFADADHIFCGEAEGRLGTLVSALASGSAPRMLADDGPRPELSAVPPPRYDLLRRSRYASMSLQYSRGCPFSCEFCDIVELFGRVPRVKSAAQVLGEMDALFAEGWRGSLFFVDDNFIGNRKAVLQLLPEIARWQREHRFPFELYTEASIDLAAQPALLQGMVEAGFSTVFVGIETPSTDALRETHKLQNLKSGLADAVHTITRAGLEVCSGFIVGFDADGPGIFETQRSFIDGLPIPTAMVGLLTALPGTNLWRRMERERRLRGAAGGDQFGTRPNFLPALDERLLLEGYRGLLASLYRPDAFFARCDRLLRAVGKSHSRPLTAAALLMFVRIVWALGILSPRRVHFWRLFALGVRRPHTFARAVTLATQGEHLLRYTEEDVLPRLDSALAQLDRERAAIPALASSPGP
jgi:radical SAM superfamily enzyme YgiQ (UPF0313 family)